MSLASCFHWAYGAVTDAWTKSFSPSIPTSAPKPRRRILDLTVLEDRILMSAAPLDLVFNPEDANAGEAASDEILLSASASESLAAQGGDRATAILFSAPRDHAASSAWDGTGFGPAAATAGGQRWSILAGAEAPTRDEMIVVGVDRVSGEIVGEIWDGAAWELLPLDPLSTVGSRDHWGFAVAYEQQSGDAILVWNQGTSGAQSLAYSIYDGSSWSAISRIDTPLFSEPRHMQLAANSRTDEMVLVVSDAHNDDYALVWDGDSWGNSQVLDTTHSGETDVDVVYEHQSGDAIVVFGSGTSESPRFRVWDGNRWSSEGTVAAPRGESLAPRWVTLAADPTSDRALLGVATEGSGFSSHVWLSSWTGDAWQTAAVATTGLASDVDTPSVAVAFESQTGQGLAAFGFERVGSNLGFMTWNDNAGWSAPLTGPRLAGHPLTLTLDADANSDGIMLLVQDDGRALSSVFWDGMQWNTPQVLESDTGDTHHQPFVFLWSNDRLSNRPPDAIAGGPYDVNEGGSRFLDGTSSSDIDGTITSYEWDFDYDGVTFDVDAVGANPLFSAATLDGPQSRTIALRVTDDKGLTSGVTTANLAVHNLPPVAADDRGSGFETQETTPLVTGDVLANDVDPSPLDVLRVVAIDTTTTRGLVVDLGDGTFRYDPNGQFTGLRDGERATDQFVVWVQDADGGSDQATVTITIHGVSDPVVVVVGPTDPVTPPSISPGDPLVGATMRPEPDPTVPNSNPLSPSELAVVEVGGLGPRGVSHETDPPPTPVAELPRIRPNRGPTVITGHPSPGPITPSNMPVDLDATDLLGATVAQVPTVAEAPLAAVAEAVTESLVFNSTLIGHNLDAMAYQLRTQAAAHSLLVGGAFGIAATLTAGYALWLLRGGQLLTSLVAQLPAWQLLDPLVILDRSEDEDQEDTTDDVSVESLVEGAAR